MTDTSATDALDSAEWGRWIMYAQRYRESFVRLCAHPVDALLDAAGVSEGMYVLDAGTGTGTAARRAQRRGARVRGVDVDPGGIAQARGSGVNATNHPLPELPFADGEFDVVLANFVIDCLDRPRTSLAELRRVLRPGGRIALTLWGARRGAGQNLLGRACEAGGIVLPPDRPSPDEPRDLPPLDADEEFDRTPAGMLELLGEAGFTRTEATEVTWNHETTVREWWGGLADRLYLRPAYVTPPDLETTARICAEYERLSAEFPQRDEKLLLPHVALLASGRLT